MRNLVSSRQPHVPGYSHVQTVGYEQMHSHFARLVRAHEAELAETRSDFLAELQYAPLSRVILTLAAVEVSMTVRAQPKNTWQVFGATDKTLEMEIARRQTVVPPGRIAIVPPGVPYQLFLPAGGCRTLMLEIEPGFLESILAGEIHGDVERPLCFHAATGAQEHSERHFVELLNFLRNELAIGAPQCHSAYYVARLEQLLGAALLHAAAHNYSAQLAADGDAAAPRHVRRAEDFIHAHAAEGITLKALAGIAAVSPRTLVRAFRKYKHCAPATYLRSVRLDRCREELQTAMPEDTSVTRVAAKWGFSNIGRFAVHYRQRFGENPVETLRRRSRN